MQLDTIPTPHGWQLVYLAVASLLSSAGTLIVDRFIKRKREPAEIRKINAEAHSIHVSSEISPVGITLETLREIQEVIRKAEARRDEWHSKEEQMRTQIIFWRNKAEEFDGKLIDLQQDLDQLQTRYNKKHHELKGAMALLLKHEISYAELDTPSD